MSKKEQQHRRRSIRLPGFDYRSSGAYFVTICAHNRYRNPFLHPQLKQIIEQRRDALTEMIGVTLDTFIIMSDHVHFIVWLDATLPKFPKLGCVVGTFKSSVTRSWNRYQKSVGGRCVRDVWQRNYFERIIRTNDELEFIRQYIKDNPTKELPFLDTE
jgi:putative transposase